MSSFLIGEGVEISVDGVTYKGDSRGVVNLPSEFDEALVNRHGLTLYVETAEAEAPDASDAPETTEATAARRGRPRKVDAPETAEATAEEAPAA